MKTIHKFVVENPDYFSIVMPEGSDILTLQRQYGVPCLWAKVDTGKMMVTREFVCYGTGHEIRETDKQLEYIGTWQLDGGKLIFHLFEIVYVTRSRYT